MNRSKCCKDCLCKNHIGEAQYHCVVTSCSCHKSAEKKCDCPSCKAGHKNGHNVLKALRPTSDTSDVTDKELDSAIELLPKEDTSDSWRERFDKREWLRTDADGNFYPDSDAIKAFIERELERTIEECSKLAVQQEQRYYEAGRADERARLREVCCANCITKLKLLDETK